MQRTLFTIFVLIGISSLLAMPVAAQPAKRPTNERKQEKDEFSGLMGMQSRTLKIVEDEGAVKGKQKQAAVDGLRKTNNTAQVFRDLNGRRTIEINDDKKLGIKVVITTRYSGQDKKQLVRRFPDLDDYIQLFPKNIEGHAIAMDLSLTSVHEARNLEELKAKHSEAYQLYRRYYKSANANKLTRQRRN